jgi:hypothetical protein
MAGVIDEEFLDLTAKDLPYSGSDYRRLIEGFFTGTIAGLKIIQSYARRLDFDAVFSTEVFPGTIGLKNETGLIEYCHVRRD